MYIYIYIYISCVVDHQLDLLFIMLHGSCPCLCQPWIHPVEGSTQTNMRIYVLCNGLSVNLCVCVCVISEPFLVTLPSFGVEFSERLVNNPLKSKRVCESSPDWWFKENRLPYFFLQNLHKPKDMLTLMDPRYLPTPYLSPLHTPTFFDGMSTLAHASSLCHLANPSEDVPTFLKARQHGLP